jgi:hypothetical protein
LARRLGEGVRSSFAPTSERSRSRPTNRRAPLPHSPKRAARQSAAPLLRFVRLSSERAMQAVRKDCSLPKKRFSPCTPGRRPGRAGGSGARPVAASRLQASSATRTPASPHSQIGSVTPDSGAAPLPRRDRPWFACGVEHVPRIGPGRLAGCFAACPGTPELYRPRPGRALDVDHRQRRSRSSLPRRPVGEDTHLLQLERRHDVQQRGRSSRRSPRSCPFLNPAYETVKVAASDEFRAGGRSITLRDNREESP